MGIGIFALTYCSEEHPIFQIYKQRLSFLEGPLAVLQKNTNLDRN